MGSHAGRTVDHDADWIRRCLEWFGLTTSRHDPEAAGTSRRPAALEDRLDSIGWGLLFLFVAALALPSGTAEYASVAVLGGLFLLLNVGRILLGVRASWLSVIIGSSMLIGGVSALAGTKVDLFALFFLLVGLVTIAAALRPWRTTDREPLR